MDGTLSTTNTLLLIILVVLIIGILVGRFKP